MILTLAKPSRDPGADYDLALAKRRKLSVKRLLTAARADVLAAYAAYEDVAGSPSKLKPLTVTEQVSDALRSNYFLTYSDAPLSTIRDEAIAATFQGLCPMCGRGDAVTLDHYLPRDRFPEFSVLAINLVPVCVWCNGKKSTQLGSEETGRFFHAYYDRIPDVEPLLSVDVTEEGGTVSATFRINGALPGDVYKNAAFHFDALDLATLYASASALEMIERAAAFLEIYEIGGAGAVSATAMKEAKRLRKHVAAQYWKAALYEGISKSPEFCAGGFSLLLG